MCIIVVSSCFSVSQKDVSLHEITIPKLHLFPGNKILPPFLHPRQIPVGGRRGDSLTPIPHHFQMAFERLRDFLAGLLDRNSNGDTAWYVRDVCTVAGARPPNHHDVAHPCHSSSS